MVRHIIVSDGQRTRTTRFGGLGKPSRFEAAAPSIEALGPEEALFVSTVERSDEERLLVVRLARALRSRFPGLVMIKDFDKKGVWVYRPALRGPGGGQAVGPQKEAEIMGRRLGKPETV